MACYVLACFASPSSALGQQPVSPLLPPAPAWSGASEKLIVGRDDRWITPAEASGFTTSPAFAEVRQYLDRLAAASPLISVHGFGHTTEGRELLYVRASKGGAPKPVVMVQAGIHSGEIDGKDAGLMLLRDIAFRGKADILDKVDLVFVPVLNVDGHERMTAFNRPHQRGPAEKGERANARNINLNRDYAKLDAPETRAVVALLRQFDPILYVDLHDSDGFDQQYDISFTYAGWGRYARHRATADWLEQRFTDRAMTALTQAGHIPVIYPSPIDVRDPSKGIRYSPEGPRYSTGYGDFIGIPTVLVENHMLKPFRQRVLGTYVLLEAALRLAGQDADRIAAAKAADRASRPATLLTRWTQAAQPIGWIDFKGIGHDLYLSPASGRQEQRWDGQPRTLSIPIIGQSPAETVTLPKAWWIPPEQVETIERLKWHGIAFDTIDAPRTLPLDQITVTEARPLPPSDGRYPIDARVRHETAERTLPIGSVRVSADQPLGLLAAALLEPESQDSLMAWGFYPEMLTAPVRTEAFVFAPMADRMLEQDAQLKAAFQAKLDADPGFAADGEARLNWLFDHSPYRDRFVRSYPILREPR
ncbi:M14 family metallopeptidase [Sphingomonas sanguinis]|uniref:M14 family metallopeptidase n=1 Tax=Sphingomonas sp. LC-1 TaxID=3110957 RepID=UPI0021BABAD4|nr:M14 family metallopeptidase [Sphingomonas sp. LC-1]MCT8003050.1 M14 family metallopeptidase [Sphingomonas sp. LC-1]